VKISWGSVATTVLGVGVIAALGAAIDTRDGQRANAAEIRRVDDVQTERYKAIHAELERLREDLRQRRL